MSIRSTIAILNTDGSVQSVYSNFDGNLPVNGIILYEHYKDISKVKQLIALGSVSSLKENLVPPEGVSHTLDKAHPGVTTFYPLRRKIPSSRAGISASQTFRFAIKQNLAS